LTTSTAWRGRAVGIIRAEREIALRLLRDTSLAVLPIIFHNGRLRAVDPTFAQKMILEDTARSPDAEKAALEVSRPNLRRVIRPFVAFARRGVRIGLRGVPVRARSEVTLSLKHMREALRRLIYPPPPSQPDVSLVVHPREGDVLFTCGVGWDRLDWSAIAALRERYHFRVVCVCYDIIPVLFPQWIPTAADMFLSHFLRMIDLADAVPCISQCTERDLHALALTHGRPVPSTHVVRLGADLPAKAEPEGIDPELSRRFAAERFALAVSTFDVRKNYRLLLDVWDHLTRDSNFDLDLVIVGMRGWGAEDVITRLEASPLYGHRIFWFTNLGDAGLSWLYERCHMALYPSLYEGWGLPVVEALQHRRPVVASNRGAVPEAGLGIARIVDPDDLAAWCDAVAETARTPRASTPLAVAPSWDDAARSIRSILLRTAP
jgi:glycosyltransferase involved in cell wall biosynthesis